MQNKLIEVKQELQPIIDRINDNIENMGAAELTMLTVKLCLYLPRMAEIYAHIESSYYAKWNEINYKNKPITDGKTDKLAKATSEYMQKVYMDKSIKAINELIKSLKKRLTIYELEKETNIITRNDY